MTQTSVYGLCSFTESNSVLLTGTRLRPFRAIFRATLFSVRYTDGIQGSSNYVVTNARQILHTAATNQHDGVLLKVVANSRYVGCHLYAVGQTHSRNLPQRRIWLFWRLRIDTRANSAFLGRTLQSRTGRFVFHLLTALANQLIYRRHCFPLNRANRYLTRKKALPCLFPELVRQSAQVAALYILV